MRMEVVVPPVRRSQVERGVAGFTLVEVVIALAIVTTGALSLAALSAQAGEIVARWQAVDPNIKLGSFKLEYQATSSGPWERVAVESPPSAMKHTLSGRQERMLMKLVVDAKTDRVLGVHILGPDAGEMAQLAGIAMKMGATKAQFDATMAVHPTAAEELVTMRTKVGT